MRRRWWAGCVLLMVACKSPDGRDDSGGTTDVTTMPPTATMPTTSGTTGGTTEATTGGPGSTGSSTGDPVSSSSDSSGGPKIDVGTTPDLPDGPPLPKPQVWYSIENILVYIELDPLDGTVVQLVTSTINNNPSLAGNINSCSLTMLADGSLLGGRGNEVGTRMFHIAEPPTVASNIDVDILGPLPGAIYVEALHTDCDGRVYLMDTGVDNVSNTGNRLLRFKDDYLAGNFAYDVITDLQVAVSVDIDDMAPGIDAGGEIRDNPGYGIDSEMVYALDYTDGTGMLLGMAGTYGIHALGGPLFGDGESRLYVLDIDANLFEADPMTLALSPSLATGPALMSGNPRGNTGLAGPLTDCITGFPPG
jgi:hypothetical protein